MKLILVKVLLLVYSCFSNASKLIQEKDNELYLNKFFCKLLSSNVLSCGFKYEPVCGTDNKTHKNYCYLARHSCESSESLQLANFGKCKSEDCDRLCSLEYEPVCATNGVTFNNICFLSMALCNANKNGDEKFSFKHNGRCLACNRVCPKIYWPICGSDGKTYANK